MATGLFTAYTEGLMNGDFTLDLLTADIQVAIIPNSSPPDLDDATIDFEDDLGASVFAANHRESLAAKAIADGVFDNTADTVIDAATANAVDSDLFLYDSQGSPTTTSSNRLIAYFDLASPFQPNGQDVNVQWHANGIFKLG